jgi:protein SMG8
LEHVEFPVFEPSIANVKAAVPLSKSLFYPFDSRTSSQSPSASDQDFQSQPDHHASFTNLSQSSIPGDNHEDGQKEDAAEGTSADALAAEEDDEESAEDDDEDVDYAADYPDTFRPYLAIGKQSSTTEYLPGMIHTLSPSGLLPKFSSWSLVCLGPSSLYS